MSIDPAIFEISQFTGFPSPVQLLPCISNDVQAAKNINSMKDGLLFKTKLDLPFEYFLFHLHSLWTINFGVIFSIQLPWSKCFPWHRHSASLVVDTHQVMIWLSLLKFDYLCQLWIAPARVLAFAVYKFLACAGYRILRLIFIAYRQEVVDLRNWADQLHTKVFSFVIRVIFCKNHPDSPYLWFKGLENLLKF